MLIHISLVLPAIERSVGLEYRVSVPVLTSKERQFSSVADKNYSLYLLF